MRTACTRCRKRRTGCRGGTPCESCLKSNVPCEMPKRQLVWVETKIGSMDGDSSRSTPAGSIQTNGDHTDDLSNRDWIFRCTQELNFPLGSVIATLSHITDDTQPTVPVAIPQTFPTFRGGRCINVQSTCTFGCFDDKMVYAVFRPDFQRMPFTLHHYWIVNLPWVHDMLIQYPQSFTRSDSERTELAQAVSSIHRIETMRVEQLNLHTSHPAYAAGLILQHRMKSPDLQAFTISLPQNEGAECFGRLTKAVMTTNGWVLGKFSYTGADGSEEDVCLQVPSLEYLAEHGIKFRNEIAN